MIDIKGRMFEDMRDHALEYGGDYYRLAYSYVKNEEAAIEVTTEAIYFSLYNARKIDGRPNFINWFLQVVLKSALRTMRDQKYPRTFTKNSERYAYFETLDHSKTTIFKLFHFWGLSIDDIVEILRSDEKTVFQQLRAAENEMSMFSESEETREGKSATAKEVLNELRTIYLEPKIPPQLGSEIQKVLDKEQDKYEESQRIKEKNRIRKPLGVVVLAAAIFFLTIAAGRANPDFAESIMKIPFVGNLFSNFF